MSYYDRSNEARTRGPQSHSKPVDSLSDLPPERKLKEGLESAVLKTLQKPEIVDTEATGPITPKNVKYIGSYNWVDDYHPTIIVPGCPRVWNEREPEQPYRIPYDTGIHLADQNGFRMGNASTLLPLFRAVDVVAEENADTTLDWSDIDIVTDRNGLRKLMRWLRHSGLVQDKPLDEFRIDLQLGGEKTVLMHQWEKRTRQMSKPPKTGCGFNFERMTTYSAPGCERSTGHHRIIRYELGGMNLVVRCEVDACTADSLPPLTRTEAATAPKSTDISGDHKSDVDDLVDAIADVGISSPPTTGDSATPGTVSVIRAGSQVPQDSIVELVTRARLYVSQFDWNEQYPQLLLSYTPHLFLGVHTRGMFDRVKKLTLGDEELKNVESNEHLQRTFRQLVSVLRTIQDLVKEHGRQGRLTLICDDGAMLKVYKRTSDAGCLTEKELERFNV
ncbi:hypothetical protein BD413DRAFT_611082 [Trametes elegans]|nr:hypothetical protein BD413DRAFT_611082 [Trametes elegans]